MELSRRDKDKRARGERIATDSGRSESLSGEGEAEGTNRGDGNRDRRPAWTVWQPRRLAKHVDSVDLVSRRLARTSVERRRSTGSRRLRVSGLAREPEVGEPERSGGEPDGGERARPSPCEATGSPAPPEGEPKASETSVIVEPCATNATSERSCEEAEAEASRSEAEPSRRPSGRASRGVVGVVSSRGRVPL